MEPGYFRSREFAIAGAVACAILLGGALLLSDVGLGLVEHHGTFGCHAPTGAGALQPLAQAPGPAPRTRALTWSLDASTLAEGSVDLCTDVGSIRVGASNDSLVHLTFLLSAPRTDETTPLDGTDVRVGLRQQAGRAEVAAWVASQPTYAAGGLSTLVVHVDVEILLPPNVAFDLRATGNHGDIEVREARLRDVIVKATHEPARLRDVHLAGNLTVTSSSGGIDVRLASVQSARILLASSYGGVTMEAPLRADVGYDVTAESRYGETTVQMGPAETYETRDETTHVRTLGYDAKPTKVLIHAKSATEDVSVTASSGSA